MTGSGEPKRRDVKSVALIGKRTPVLLPEVVRRVESEIKARSIAVACETETARILGRPGEGRELAQLAGAVDLAVSLGGDGTLLAVARAFAPAGTPIIGVNLGRLGFLTEVELAEFPAFLDGYLSGGQVIDERMMLEVRLEGSDEARVDPPAVLNDVVVARSQLARTLELGIAIDGAFVASCRVDGIVVATPTGSTAYSLASGGSVLAPDLDAIIVSPICPHASSLKPFVVPAASEVRITLAKGHREAHVSLDGQEGFRAPEGAELVVRRSRLVTRVARDPWRSFYQVLRAKLGWSGRLAR